MYDKEKIDELGWQFLKDRSDETLDQLIAACQPMVDSLISRYPKTLHHRDDIRQDVCLALTRLLRRTKPTKDFKPFSFLFSRIRFFVRHSSLDHAVADGTRVSPSPTEFQVMKMRDEEGLEWEDIGARLGIKEKTVRRAYDSGKKKMAQDLLSPGDHMESAAADDKFVDPARLYEVKDLLRAIRKKVERMAEVRWKGYETSVKQEFINLTMAKIAKRVSLQIFTDDPPAQPKGSGTSSGITSK